MNLQAAKTKIVNCVLSCTTVEQLKGCQKMMENLTIHYMDCRNADFDLTIMNVLALIDKKETELFRERYFSGCDPIPGCCEKCGEPINNAEYTICAQCDAEEAEYWKDVHSETGCSRYGYDG